MIAVSEIIHRQEPSTVRGTQQCSETGGDQCCGKRKQHSARPLLSEMRPYKGAGGLCLPPYCPEAQAPHLN